MLACAVLYAPSLWWSLGLDQNIFAEIGSLILKGQKPYLDAWDVKPPNIFYTYALFEWLFGQNEMAVRISDYLFTLFACATIFVGVRRRVVTSTLSDWMKWWSPPVAAVLMALTLLSLGLSDTAQTESYALAFVLLAAYLAISRNRWSIATAGALIGIATFYKTTNAVFLLPLLIEMSVLHSTRGKRAESISLLVLGFIAWCALEIAVLAAMGVLGGYLEIAFAVIQRHTSEPGDVSMLSMLRILWVSVDIWAALAAFAIIVAIIRADRTLLKVLRLPLMYLGFGLLAVYAQQKGWGYHYVITHPGLISTCAIGVVYLLDKARERARPFAGLCFVALAVPTFIATPSARRRVHYASDSFKDRATYIASLGTKQSLYYPAGTDSLAAYFRRTTSPTDSIFIFGEEPGAYWKSGRTPADRHLYALLFTSGVIGDAELRSLSYGLTLTRPRLIVIERFDTTAFRGRPETSESLVESDSNFRDLKQLLLEAYIVTDTVCDKFIIYRRR